MTGRPDGADVPVIVLLEPGRFAEVAGALRDAGLAVGSAHRRTGTVTGTVPEERIAELESLDGVAAVERGRRFVVPPPDSPIQ